MQWRVEERWEGVVLTINLIKKSNICVTKLIYIIFNTFTDYESFTKKQKHSKYIDLLFSYRVLYVQKQTSHLQYEPSVCMGVNSIILKFVSSALFLEKQVIFSIISLKAYICQIKYSCKNIR